MRITREDKASVSLNGIEYKPDKNGVIDIPDNLFVNELYGFGFVNAPDVVDIPEPPKAVKATPKRGEAVTSDGA